MCSLKFNLLSIVTPKIFNESDVLIILPFRFRLVLCVKAILARFCDGSRQTSYDLRLVLDGLRRFLTILAINEINNELRVFFLLPCYKTVVNRKESSLDNL